MEDPEHLVRIDRAEREVVVGNRVTDGFPDSPTLKVWLDEGSHRFEDFLLWDLAYTELYFTELLWPDFDGAALDGALGWFATRERRFGQVAGVA